MVHTVSKYITSQELESCTFKPEEYMQLVTKEAIDQLLNDISSLVTLTESTDLGIEGAYIKRIEVSIAAMPAEAFYLLIKQYRQMYKLLKQLLYEGNIEELHEKLIRQLQLQMKQNKGRFDVYDCTRV